MKATSRTNSSDSLNHLKNSVTEIEITYHHKVKFKDRPLIESSVLAYQLLKKLWSPQIGLLEECHLLLLDRSSRLLGHMLLSKGGFHSTQVDRKVIFSSALKARASSFIISHNHPSGNLRPSHQDIQLTQNLVRAGKILDIPISDHLILSSEGGYFSFADEGLLEDVPY